MQSWFGRRILLFPERHQRIVMILALSILILGFGMLSYRAGTTQEVQAQGVKNLETIQMGSVIKENSTKTFGTIPASSGSWIRVGLSSNRSITLIIRSSLTGTIFNYSGTTFNDDVLILNSTDYLLSATNPPAQTAALKGNATLTSLSLATIPVEKTMYPLRAVGIAFVSLGAIALIYYSLPKDYTRKRSLDFLFS